MSAAESASNLRIELQNELVNANQLLSLISIEIQKIKNFTCAGSEFERTIQHNASLTAILGKMQRIDFENLPTLPRTTMNN